MKVILADDGTLINADYITMIGIRETSQANKIIAYLRGREKEHPVLIVSFDSHEVAMEYMKELAAQFVRVEV